MSEPRIDEPSAGPSEGVPAETDCWFAFRLGLIVNRLWWYSTQLYLWPTQERAIATLGELTRLRALALEESLADIAEAISGLESRLESSAGFLIKDREESDPRLLGSGNRVSWRAYRGEYGSLEQYFDFWERAPGEIPLDDLEDCVEYPPIASDMAFGHALSCIEKLIDESLCCFTSAGLRIDPDYFDFGSRVDSGACPDPIRWLLGEGLTVQSGDRPGELLTDSVLNPAGTLPPDAGWVDLVQADWAQLQPTEPNLITVVDKVNLTANKKAALELIEELSARVASSLCAVPASSSPPTHGGTSEPLEIAPRQSDPVRMDAGCNSELKAASSGEENKRSRSRPIVESIDEREAQVSAAILGAPPFKYASINYIHKITKIPPTTISKTRAYRKYLGKISLARGKSNEGKSVRAVVMPLENASSHGRSVDPVGHDDSEIRLKDHIVNIIKNMTYERKKEVEIAIFKQLNFEIIDPEFLQFDSKPIDERMMVLYLLASGQAIEVPEA